MAIIKLSGENEEFQWTCWLVHGVRIIYNYNSGRYELEYDNPGQAVRLGIVKFTL